MPRDAPRDGPRDACVLAPPRVTVGVTLVCERRLHVTLGVTPWGLRYTVTRRRVTHNLLTVTSGWARRGGALAARPAGRVAHTPPKLATSLPRRPTG